MVRSLRVRHHGLDRVHVGAMDAGAATKLTFVLGRLLGEDVALERLRALDRTAPAYAEALLGARLGLHFRHDALLSICCPRRCSPRVAGERLWRVCPHRRQAWFRDARLPPSWRPYLPPCLPPRSSSGPAASPFAGPPVSATTRPPRAVRDRSEYVPAGAHRIPGAPFRARESEA